MKWEATYGTIRCIVVCFTIEILYYTLLLITSYIYLKKAKWQNKKI